MVRCGDGGPAGSPQGSRRAAQRRTRRPLPHPRPLPCPCAACRRASDGSELLHVPLGEEVLQQVLQDMDAMG